MAISRKAVLPQPCHQRVVPPAVKCMVNIQPVRRVRGEDGQGFYIPLRGVLLSMVSKIHIRLYIYIYKVINGIVWYRIEKYVVVEE